MFSPNKQQEEPVSVKDNIKSIEVIPSSQLPHSLQELITQASINLREYKKEIECLRQDISMMENHLGTINDENVKVLNPMLMSNFESLQQQIVQQRHENDHMQKQLTELKREKSVMQQQIMAASSKIAQLEDSVGL